MAVTAWIKDYVLAHLGKQTSADREWDKDHPCLAQIIDCEPRRGRVAHSGISIILSDTENQIQCKVIPKLIGIHGERTFEKNRIINLTKVELKLTADFQSVYFVLMQTQFLSSIPVLPIGKNRSVPNINKLQIIQHTLQKYRTCLSFEFKAKPGDQIQGYDINQIPYSLHSAQESFGFEHEINSLKQSFDSFNTNNQNNGALQQIDDITQHDLAALCLEEAPRYKVQLNVESNEHDENNTGDEKQEQQTDEHRADEQQEEENENDNDEEMVQDDTEPAHEKSEAASTSDKREMDEEDEEKQIVDSIVTNTDGQQQGNEENQVNNAEQPASDAHKAGDQEHAESLSVRPKFAGNECDWLHCLYPEFDDIPSKIKRLKPIPMEAPIHTAPRTPKTSKKRKAPPGSESVVDAKRQKTMIPEDEGKSSGEQTYSQTSWTSTDIAQCDQAAQRFNQQRLQQQQHRVTPLRQQAPPVVHGPQRQQQQQQQQFQFAQPQYSLSDRYRKLSGERDDNHNHHLPQHRINESILSVQESVASVDENILSSQNSLILNDSHFEAVEDDEKQAVEKKTNGDNDADMMELEELFGSVGSEERDMDVIEKAIEVQEEDFMNEPVDKAYLGNVSRNDLEKIQRYFIKVSQALNANLNDDPNNPLRV